MKLIINDPTNSAKELYYQSLVLLFMPCEKFGIEDNKNTLFVDVNVSQDAITVFVKLEVCEKVSTFTDNEKIVNGKFMQIKNFIGRCIVKCANAVFGIFPPWGISTGVKPVKLARIFVKSLGADAAFDILVNDYMISPPKAKMAVDACVNEDRIIGQIGENPCSVYISIPFCPTKCNYCSFVSAASPRLFSLIPEYLNYVKNDLKLVSDVIRQKSLNVKSIYIGGGTPAILKDHEIEFLLNCVNDTLDFTSDVEFTFEAGRPDCITKDKLLAIKRGGVNRISINTQTANNNVLKAIGRNHSFEDYLNCFEEARNVGFDCINTDLIAGLPGESYESFCESVEKVANVNPENITVHAFTLKRSSNYRIDGEKSFETSFEDAVRMTDFSNSFLREKGYFPYYIYRQKNTVANLENSGFAKKSFESLYNIVMMGEYHTVFGIGVGSVTKSVTCNGCGVNRIFSPKYPYEYLDKEKYGGFDTENCLKLLEER